MRFSNRELVGLLAQSDFSAVYSQADRLCRERKGVDLQIRALLEFSNHCKRNCLYCGLNCENTGLPRFRLTPDEIVETARQAQAVGYRTIVLQSGEDSWFTPERLGEIIRRIKTCNIAVTLSCGEFPAAAYRRFRECGADRYLLKHETSDPAIYAALHPGASLAERVRCLRDCKAAGLQAGGGFMIGLPGQTLATIANDLLLLEDIPCDMAGIGPFLPHPATPLRDAPHGDAELTRRAVALARLLLPEANLPATTALGVLDPQQKRDVFDCGANVIMQKVTPSRVKRLYQIYPSHLADTDLLGDRRALEAQIRSMGRNPV